MATKLGQTTFGLFASQDYLQARGVPTCLDDLKAHDCLHMGGSRYGDYWSVLRGGDLVRFRLPWAMVLPNKECLICAAAAGMGIVMIPELFAERHVENGELTRLQSVAAFPKASVYVLYPTRKHLPYRVGLFLNFLKDWTINGIDPSGISEAIASR